MDYYKRAVELNDDTVANRRYIHENAEVGLELPNTVEYIMKKLEEYGLKPEKCGHGVTTTVGRGGKVILLRADMDALPMTEESGESFASNNKNAAHCCGHDFHAAMLLTAARMLKENEKELKGTVKFMFQPAEEIFEGSKDMVENGLLKNPKPDVALAAHVVVGRIPIGTYMYNSKGTMMYSVDGFKITAKGKGSHGAYPHVGIDPINIGAHIHLALQELVARESDPSKAVALTVGKFQAGTAANIIPETAVLEGTLRTNDSKMREKIVNRIKEVAEKTAEVYGGSASIEMIYEVPTITCDSKLTEEFVKYIKEINGPEMIPYPDVTASASDDFAVIAEQIPSTYLYISAGFMDERGDYPVHHPKVKFNEEVCPIGSSVMAHLATRWLGEN